MSTNFLKWKWTSAHVQTEIVNGEYVTSEATLICAGPPRLEILQAVSDAGSTQNILDVALEQSTSPLMPIGLISNFQMSQSRQVNRLFEIGSVRAYLIPGKMFATFSMGRVKFYGPSMLRMLYSWYPDSALDFDHGRFDVALSDEQSQQFGPGGSFPAINYEDAPGFGSSDANVVGVEANVDGAENNNDFWINLTSVIFRQSTGLALIFKASNNRTYGATYLEDVMLEGHGFGIDANNVVITEATNGQFDRARPIRMLSVSQSV